MKIFITKPGNDLQHHEGKSNMQIRELEVVKGIYEQYGIDSVLIRTSELCETNDLDNSLVICFVSIQKFNHEFEKLVKHLENFENVHLVCVMNDPRLKFSLTNAVSDKLKISLIVNTTRSSTSYGYNVFARPSSVRVNIIEMPLWTMPSFYLHEPKAEHIAPRHTSAFYCLHFNECSYQRRKTVQDIVDAGVEVIFAGADYPDNFESKGTIESSKITEFLNGVDVVPVILEPEHITHRCLTSRVAEAIVAGCWPFIIHEESIFGNDIYSLFPNGTVAEFVAFTKMVKGVKPNRYFKDYLREQCDVLSNEFMKLCKTI